MTLARKADRRRGGRFAFGIDIGGTTIKIGLVDVVSGSVLDGREMPTHARHASATDLNRIAETCSHLIPRASAKAHPIAAVGVAVAELVDRHGKIRTHGLLPWTSVGIRRALERFGPVVVSSDVQAAALAEARYGAGRGCASFLYVSVGTGVSSSLVIDGKPFVGTQGFGIAFASGPTLVGKRRSRTPLEQRVGGPGLVRRAKQANLAVRDCEELCELGARRAGPERVLIQCATRELASAVGLLANALDPEKIVLGGGLGSAPGYYWRSFRTAFPNFLYNHGGKLPTIRRAALRSRSGVVGSALWAAMHVAETAGRAGDWVGRSAPTPTAAQAGTRIGHRTRGVRIQQS